MTTIKYNITSNEGERTSVTVFIGTKALVSTKDQPNFDTICEAVTGGEMDPVKIESMFDIGFGISKKFEHLTERVTINTGKLFFDGDVMDDALAQTIIRFFYSKNEFQPLVNFLEKIMVNPEAHSRENLFRWMRDRRFPITPDGDFIAYKGVNQSQESIHSGYAIVNGIEIKGRVPNKPGTVIEMPRSKVEFNPRASCSTGLHAGNWRYASSFSRGAILRVKINPRDVVSVPTDSSDEKLRVCRYRVLDVVRAEDTEALYVPSDDKLAKAVVPKAVLLVQEPKPKRVRTSKAAPVGVVAEIDFAGVPENKKAKAEKTQPEPKEVQFPEYYHDFKRLHFEACVMSELTWLCGEWEVTLPSKGRTKKAVIDLLMKEAPKQRRAYAKAK